MMLTTAQNSNTSLQYEDCVIITQNCVILAEMEKTKTRPDMVSDRESGGDVHMLRYVVFLINIYPQNCGGWYELNVL